MNYRTTYITDEDHHRLTTLLSQMKRGSSWSPAYASNLRRKLERAVVLPSSDIPYHVITMYSQFRLQDLDTGKTRDYTLVYPHEADFHEGKLSVFAPVGTALLGAQDLDEVEWESPAGCKRFRVNAIYYQPEAAEAYRIKADSLIPGSRRAERRPGQYA